MVFNKLCTIVHYLVEGENGIYTKKDSVFVGRIPASKVEKPAGMIIAGTEYVKKRVTVDDEVINRAATFDDLPEASEPEQTDAIE